MNHLDDNELIDQLRAGLADRTDDVHAPDGIADGARRLARRRTTTRAVGAGVPVLAAAGVATAVLVGSGGQVAHTTIVPGTSSATAPGAHAQDTAYIVKRVKAKVADGEGGTVLDYYDYSSGDVSSDGSLVNLGSQTGAEYSYTAADGTAYTRNVYDYADGSPRLTIFNVFVPDGNGAAKGTFTSTNINPVTHIYSQLQTHEGNPEAVATPTLDSPSAVQHALQNGQVSQTGTATIDGTPAIALLVKVPTQGARVPGVTLYVDAQTYQPLRLVGKFGNGLPGLFVDEWMPATAANIAQAKETVPAGYREVKAPTYGRAGGYSGNSGAGPLAQPDTGSGNSGNTGTSGNS